MVWLCLGLIPLAALLAVAFTALVIRVSRRIGALDGAGVPGQVKAAPRLVPNTGGLAIVLAIMLPILAGLWFYHGLDASPNADWRNDFSFIPADTHEHVEGIQRMTPLAVHLVLCLVWLHVLGLVDDRRPLGPWIKLLLMAVPAFAVPIVTHLWGGPAETRLMTLLDSRVGGPWLSILLTALWFLAVTNAMNFMDNMDGLAAGVAAVAAALFLIAAFINEQWFVATVLALVLGACVGFLVFNAPRRGGARVFMGDGGSLVLGFLLAFLTVRTTYLGATPFTFYTPFGVAQGTSADGGWYSVLMPLVVLAVPLYDAASVITIRLAQGRSPFVGDLQHLSHRLVQRGLSKPAAVFTIWGLTGVTGISGILLTRAQGWQAALLGLQVFAILAVIAAFEYASAKRPTDSP
ncbi:MAG: undecaprenyl-phosphate alpha-N-acetylglucosaminyl 1-phosphate transferase [Phycisphaerae bacterium]|nr:MAG: undecaprenyl-phosphate alpha-N-acetylglucosaminyl 1-phosphate transferase [Phycisphaerae bacterium]